MTLLRRICMCNVLIRHLSVSKQRRAWKPIEDFTNYVKKNHPKLYEMQQTAMSGGKACLGDLKEYSRIRKEIAGGKPISNLSIHELHILLLTPNDLQKMFLLCTIVILPFTVLVVGVALVFFPRFLLTRHFWTHHQIIQYNNEILQSRKRHYFQKTIFEFFQRLGNKFQNIDFARNFEKYGRITLEQQHSYESIFNSNLLSLDKLPFIHLFSLGRCHGILPLLNGELLLKNRAALIKCLDAKLIDTNLFNLNVDELEISLFVRQINTKNLTREAKVSALNRWLKFSTCDLQCADPWPRRSRSNMGSN